MSGLSREILKWLQSLNLTYPVKNPRRDFSNGFTVAQIFSRYYPHEFARGRNNEELYSYDTGSSLQKKVENWELLHRFFVKQNIPITKEIINDTVHNKPNAGIQLIELMYKFLVEKVPIEEITAEISTKSVEIQSEKSSNIPKFARPTASKLIKESIPDSEVKANKNTEQITKQVEAIVEKHKSEVRIENKTVQPLKKATKRSSNPQRLNAPRPINEEQRLDTIEFKEVQVKPVEINISELRSSRKAVVI